MVIVASLSQGYDSYFSLYLFLFYFCYFAYIVFCFVSVQLGANSVRFQLSVPANMPVLPRMKRQYNVPTVALVAQIV